MPHYIRPLHRILIVEDDRVALSITKGYLSAVGKCDVASDGESALEMFEEAYQTEEYSVVCLDIGLPDMSGIKVLTAIREIEKRRGVAKEDRARVIMTTAAGDLKDVLRAMSIGCDGYVAKPFGQEQLYVELNRAGVEFDWD